MPINAADARQLAGIMLNAYGEDVETIAGMLRPLRQQMPGINWMGELTTMANQHQPFIDSGLSIAWWLNEVNRRSTP